MDKRTGFKHLIELNSNTTKKHKENIVDLEKDPKTNQYKPKE